MRNVPAIGWLAFLLVLGGCGGSATPADAPADPAPDVPIADPGTDPGLDPGPDAFDPGPDVAPDIAGPGPGKKSRDLFDPEAVVDLALTFSEADWQQFQAYRTAQTREWVHCQAAFDGSTSPDAACRSKGNEGDWPKEKKPQFLVRFDKWNKDGRFLGLRGLDLDSSRDHPAPVRERVGFALFNAAGVPAPRVSHARVSVNGQPMGLYANVESVDREFVEGAFWNGEGNLYEVNQQGIEQRSGPGGTDLDELLALVAAEPDGVDHAAFYAGLESRIDMHRLLRELAVEVVLPTWDNLSNGSWNYYWYHVPGWRFVVIPWDLDDVVSPVAPYDADPFSFSGHAKKIGRLRTLVDTHPGWKQEFVDALVEVRDGPYQSLPGWIDATCDRIRDAHAADPNAYGTVADLDADCAAMKQAVADRTAFLKAFLGR